MKHSLSLSVLFAFLSLSLSHTHTHTVHVSLLFLSFTHYLCLSPPSLSHTISPSLSGRKQKAAKHGAEAAVRPLRQSVSYTHSLAHTHCLCLSPLSLTRTLALSLTSLSVTHTHTHIHSGRKQEAAKHGAEAAVRPSGVQGPPRRVEGRGPRH